MHASLCFNCLLVQGKDVVFHVWYLYVYDQNFQGGGVVDGEGGSSEGCLKWGGGGGEGGGH